MERVDAAAYSLATTTGHQLITLAGGVARRTVLVFGAAGGVGRSAVVTAKMLGARVIAGVTKRQLDRPASIGADEIVALDDDAAFAEMPPEDKKDAE